MIVDSTRDLVSVGALASQLQASVRSIEATAEELHINPALRLNGVVHFDGAAVDRIAAAIRGEVRRAGAPESFPDRLLGGDFQTGPEFFH